MVQIMETENNDLIDGIVGLFEQLNLLAKSTVPHYEYFTRNVEKGIITNIHQIEYEMDRMLTFCFDDEILVLYKRVLRKIFNQHPEIVKFYVDAYYDMHGENDDDELDDE